MASSSPTSAEALSLRALVALVVGSMIGSGIFALPARSAAPPAASAR